ncbi:MAG: hypothetical protein EOO61_00835 [Hymenobacter sp.]|nr:MAG: hypothetical protein EOO61_00835 [Hymenobacter sp.]
MLLIVSIVTDTFNKSLKTAVFSGLLVCLSQVIYAQQPGSKLPETAEDRITVLERNNRLLTEDLARLQRISNEDINRLQKDYKDVDSTLDDYEPILKGWKQILGTLGIITIGSAGGLMWFFFSKIPKKVDEEVNAQIATLLNTRNEQFRDMLNLYDADQLIKKTYKINLLLHQDETDEFHLQALRRQGFTVLPIKKISQLSDAQFAEDEVIVINNESKYWNTNDVEEFIHKHPNQCFYIGREPLDIKGEARNRFSAATVRAQFIGNLMNGLKYK